MKRHEISDDSVEKIAEAEHRASHAAHHELSDVSGASRLHEDSSLYAFDRRLVAPLNPPASETDPTWEEVVGYVYALKRLGFSPNAIMAVLEDAFPLSPVAKKPSDNS